MKFMIIIYLLIYHLYFDLFLILLNKNKRDI